ncbi:hypothetical protein, partial [Noviherbaspirillum galbum]
VMADAERGPVDRMRRADVPVLYGGSGGRLPPEGLQLRREEGVFSASALSNAASGVPGALPSTQADGAVARGVPDLVPATVAWPGSRDGG